MIYLGSERIITNSFVSHVTAEDYAGNHLSDVSINSTCRVINVINKFTSHQDSINYNDFLNNKNSWKDGNYYNCVSITGKTVRMSGDELGGNQIHLETFYNNEKYIIKIMHLNDILANIGDIITPNQVIAHQGNTGLVLSSKSKSDGTYGSHVHLEVLNENMQFINPREFASGSIGGNYILQSNSKNENNNQIKILVDVINIRESATVESSDIGNVYINEIYDVVDIVDSDLYTWYKINTSTNIVGYVASKKDDNWIEYISKTTSDIINNNSSNNNNENNLELIFTCSKEDYYYLKLYEGETLYIKKQD